MFKIFSDTAAAAAEVPASGPSVAPNAEIIFNFYQMHVHPVFHSNGYIMTSYRGKANQPNLVFENTAYIAANLVVSRNVHLDSKVTPGEILIELRPITNNRYRSVYVCFPLTESSSQKNAPSSSLEVFLTRQTNDSLSQQELDLTQYLSKTDDCNVKIDQTTRTVFITFSTPIVVHPGTNLHAITASTSVPPLRMPKITSQYKLRAVRVGDSMDDDFYNNTLRLAHAVPSTTGTDVASGIIREGLATTEEVIMDCDTFDVDGETVQTLNIPIKSQFASEVARGENVRYIAFIFSAVLMMFVIHIAVIPVFYVQILPTIIASVFDSDFKTGIADADAGGNGYELEPEIKRKGAYIQLLIMVIIFILAIILLPVGATSGNMNTLFVGIMVGALFVILIFGNLLRTVTLDGAKLLVSWHMDNKTTTWSNVWAYETWIKTEKGKEGFFW